MSIIERQLLEELRFIFKGVQVTEANMYRLLVQLLNINKLEFEERFKRLNNDSSNRGERKEAENEGIVSIYGAKAIPIG